MEGIGVVGRVDFLVGDTSCCYDIIFCLLKIIIMDGKVCNVSRN